MTVSDVLRGLRDRPFDYLCRRWNWKSAVFSPGIRAAIFLFANLKAGRHAAEAAMLTELSYRVTASGFYGALTQSFREAEPAWAASLTVLFLIPVIQHAIELTIHLLRGTPELLPSIIGSMVLTVISTLFNLYAMRRGVLIVGECAGTVWSDMRAIPATVAGFVALGAVALYRGVVWLTRITPACVCAGGVCLRRLRQRACE